MAYNSYLKLFQMLSFNGIGIGYAESPDGMTWTQTKTIHTLPKNQQGVNYITPVGVDGNPAILGKRFYVYYTVLPNNSPWSAAYVERLTVSCP